MIYLAVALAQATSTPDITQHNVASCSRSAHVAFPLLMSKGLTSCSLQRRMLCAPHDRNDCLVLNGRKEFSGRCLARHFDDICTVPQGKFPRFLKAAQIPLCGCHLGSVPTITCCRLSPHSRTFQSQLCFRPASQPDQMSSLNLAPVHARTPRPFASGQRRMQAASGRCRCSTLTRCHRAAESQHSGAGAPILDRRQVLTMLSAALAVSRGGAACADATDEEAVANKELVKDVVDDTKPAAPGEGGKKRHTLRKFCHQAWQCLSTWRGDLTCMRRTHRHVGLLRIGQPTDQLRWIRWQRSRGCQVGCGQYVGPDTKPSLT